LTQGNFVTKTRYNSTEFAKYNPKYYYSIEGKRNVIELDKEKAILEVLATNLPKVQKR
jgi:hypothetical protein